MSHDEHVARIIELVEKLRPVLAGHPPELQSAALASCVAIWLGGHHVLDNPDATRQLRDDMLFALNTTVRELVEEA